jgi:hypothetical protein
MAFIETDRVQVRKYLGYPQIWLQADPRLEAAMSNIQSVSDGGTRPNPSPSAAEVEAKAVLATLQALDASLLTLSQLSSATQVGKIRVDAAREDLRLRGVGRMHCSRLADMFDTQVAKDVFSASPPSDGFYGPGMPPGPFGGRAGY